MTKRSVGAETVESELRSSAETCGSFRSLAGLLLHGLTALYCAASAIESRTNVREESKGD